MAKKFLTPINVLNAASDPVAAAEGDLYYNTTTDQLKIYSNSAWVNVSSGSSSGVSSITGTANEIDISASTGAVTISLPATINANTTGSAASLTTARTIALSGDVSGSASFDGSASTGISTTLSNSGVSASTYGSSSQIPVLAIDAKGRVTSASVASVEGLPNQSGNNGKYLTTNGTSASWDTIDLGTDTQGNYVAQVTGSGAGISVTGTGESASVVVSNTGVTSVTGTANQVAVSASTGGVTLSLPATINVNTSGNANTATTLANSRTIELTGDVTGSASFNGGANASISATIAPNSVALGTDTTGNYVATVGGTDGVSITGSGSETAAVTIANTDKGSSQNIFKNVAVSGQSDIVADNNNDTLTVASGTGITLTTNATTDTLTVTNSGVTSISGTANEVEVSGSTGSVTVSLPSTINANTTGSAATLTNARAIALGGDLSGSANFDGSASISINATIQPDSVALGTDTTGNYVATVTGTTNQISVSGSGSENAAVTLSLPSTINVNTSGNAATATQLANSRTIALSGDVSGSVTFDGSASVNIETTIQPDSVVLGTDTTGNYVATASAGEGISISGSGSENAAITISNTGVRSLSGTANQISVSASNGDTTISLPSAVTFPGTVTLNADPTQALQAATKQYVDAVAEGLHVHASVATATTASVDLSNAPTAIDGITLTDGMRVLVKNQSNTAQNGIYTYSASADALVRASDFNTVAEIQGGDFLFVTSGNTYADTGWVQTETVTTLGTDPILFTQFSGAGTYTAGTGLQLDGTVFSNTGVLSLSGTTNEIEVSASSGSITVSLPTTINANTTGSAATLTTSRTIELSGDVSGSASFNGSANASITSTLANTAVTPATYGSASAVGTVTVDSKGRITGASNTPIAIAQSAVTSLTTDLAAKANLASPALTGTPTSPTAAVDTNTTQIATTAFVLGQASSSNPLALGSVAQGTSTRYARQDHVHPTTGLGLTSGTLAQFASTTSSQLAGVISDETGTGSLVFATSPTLTTPNIGVATGTSFNSITGLSSTTPVMDGTAAVGTGTTVARADHVHPTDTTRAALASPTFTGTPAAPTAAVDTNTTQIATTAYVVGQGYAKLASPALSGTPTAPTAAANTNSTQIATTAFVLGQGNSTAATIAMNGTQAAGTSNLYARADHVHPSDTTRAALSGATFTGTIIAPAATTSIPSIRLPHGTAPSAPTNGDLWTTTTGLFARINGTTVGPYGIGTARTFYQTTAPGSPSTGDIWVDSDEVYTTINPNDYILKSGGTFTGAVTFNAASSFTAAVSGITPTQNSHLATKEYVDNNSSGIDAFFLSGL